MPTIVFLIWIVKSSDELACNIICVFYIFMTLDFLQLRWLSCWKDEDSEQTSDCCGGCRADQYRVCTVQTDDSIWGWVDIYIDVDVVNQHFFSPSRNSASALYLIYLSSLYDIKCFKKSKSSNCHPFWLFQHVQINCKKIVSLNKSLSTN